MPKNDSQKRDKCFLTKKRMLLALFKYFWS